MSNQQSEGYTGSTKLSVRVAGPEMEHSNGYDLDSVIGSLRDTQTLLRKTYLAAQGRSRFTEKDYDSFQIKLVDWQSGSLLSDLTLNFQNVIIPVLPFISDNREFIWEALKSSYTFIKAKLSLNAKGEKYTVRQEAGEHGVNIVNNEGGTVIVVPTGLQNVAEALQPSIAQLTQNIDTKRVARVEIRSESLNDDNGKIVFDDDDRRLFNSESTLTSDDVFSISGKITSSNFDTNKGKIEITSSSVEMIKPGETYRIVISPELHAEDKWLEMFLQDRPYYCKYSVSVQNPNHVIEIQIVDWDESEWDEVS
ncbi:hypothetical protein [Lacticaseibacillus hulanensis]|uniref:hypothetical protein n=1 Tax=Lacticaseibacillus hulanensis TaxID=2493111 RepID=UPI000FD7E5F1|nr:hypothetical protein [Lacticaseibacillus hulanensis]